MSISRRKFAQLLGAGAAAAVVRPALTFANDPSATPARGSVVRLSANENPYGPSPKALAAMRDSFSLACRYPDDRAGELVSALSRLHNVGREQILLGDGSGEILKLCADVFTGPLSADKKFGGALIVADPTFEAIVYHATNNGAEIVKIPLTSSYSHDLAKMLSAAKKGLIYLCNPNNPTGSITPENEVCDFVAKVPEETMILVDEAYYHYAESSDYESVIPLVRDRSNLIVARTFSKIYGMAGLRCGYCIGHSVAIERLRARQPWDSINIMAIVGAGAGLDDPGEVDLGRRRNKETREFTIAELERIGFKTIPSQTNFIMLDAQRPVVPLIATLKSHSVEVGRLFRAMPNHLRVTIGKKAEMETFLSAFRQITSASPG
ncbi:MAG TPA: aminotransferase class I/II-fold pyridoxal phosphate-dependent enzyme [Chthoniobacterales bacterium]|jgi:histidinol-phosphate aminotransferase